MIDTSKMTRLEYLEFIQKGCPYSKNGFCSICDKISIQCDGDRFYLCEEYLQSPKETYQAND